LLVRSATNMQSQRSAARPLKHKFHDTVFRVTSSRGCHEDADATKKTASVEFKLNAARPTSLHTSCAFATGDVPRFNQNDSARNL